MGAWGAQEGAQESKRSLLSVGLSGEKGSYWSGGRGREQRGAAQGRRMSRVGPLTASVHLASSRAFMLSRLGT